MDETLKVKIALEEYNELVSTHQRYQILTKAIKDNIYVEGKYPYMKSGDLLTIFRAVDPFIDLHVKRLIETEEQKGKNE